MPRNPQVVAEGVETEDQLEQVTMLGCKYVQGYHFARPVGAKTTQALMKERDDLQRAFAVLQESASDSADSGSPEEEAGETGPPECVCDSWESPVWCQ